jgi:hypothetical protein
MNSALKYTCLATLGLFLAGCSMASSLLNNKSSVPQASTVQVGNNLAMPPDLQLPPPGQGNDNVQANVANAAPADANLAAPKAAQPALNASTAVNAPKPDIYAQYGISKLKADGTKKTPTELGNELRAAILKKKREANPNYGTIANIGNIFKDQ